MISLFINETKKLFSRKKTLIVVGLFVLLCVFAGFILRESGRYSHNNLNLEQTKNTTDMDIEYLSTEIQEYSKRNSGEDTYLEDQKALLAELKEYRRQLDTFKSEEEFKKAAIERYWKQALSDLEQAPNTPSINTLREMYESRLKNLVSPDFRSSFSTLAYFGMIGEMFTIFLMIGLALFGADMMSGEVNPPTFKHLLTQPISRTKVWLSKYFAFVVYAIILIVGVQLIAGLVVGMIGDFGDGEALVRVDVQAHKIIEGSTYYFEPIEGTGKLITFFQQTVQNFGIQILVIATCCAFIMLVSTFTKSPLVSSSIPIAIAIFFAIASGLSQSIKSKMQYIFLSYQSSSSVLNWEDHGLSQVSSAGGNSSYMMAAIVLLVTLLVFVTTSIMIFRKRDILS